MNDIVSLIQFAAVTTLVVAPAVLIHRVLARADGGTFADLFAIPVDPPWPRGVQEEEPSKWRVELLRTPAGARNHRNQQLSPRPNAQPASLGTETGRCA